MKKTKHVPAGNIPEVTLLTTTAEVLSRFQEWCLRAEEIRVVSAWATGQCQAFANLSKARDTIRTLVVGLDFHQTAPSFLESFHSLVRIGQAAGSATFHPKLYLFRRGSSYCCLIGSSNFTGGGFGANVELNVCITGHVSDPFFGQVAAFIDNRESQSEGISKTEIEGYREQFDGLAAARSRLAKFRPSAKAAEKAKVRKSQEAEGLEPPDQPAKTWQEYFALVVARQSRPGRNLEGTADDPGYLWTVEHSQELFAQYKCLRNMPLDDRRFVGGTIVAGGWFGSMRGNGLFGQRLKDDPSSLDAALDNVPLHQLITRRRFDAFVANYKWKRAGVATASRLLAMKRPDLFVCIDKENRSQIASAFSVTAASLETFDGYWNLLRRIWNCQWARAARPNDSLGRRIWAARVALLDSLYYMG